LKKKVCVITGSRAEYGLLRWVMQGIKDNNHLELQIIVTGMHLSDRYGNTYREIESDGFSIDCKLDTLAEHDTPEGISKSIANGVSGFATAFKSLSPDLILVLGDRYETFAAVVAALVACIPVAHAHGGELTEGAIDDALRHAITKMSHMHFVAAEEYRDRVIQLGEIPESVYLVGGLGIDGIQKLRVLNREELENDMNIRFLAKNLLVTFHPVTLESGKSVTQLEELLLALDSLTDTCLIFTLPNADAENRILADMVSSFVAKHDNAYAFPSLGQLKYLSCMVQVDGIVGNSSSGIIEAPYLKKGTVNIGSRQDGRLMSESIINCRPLKHEIQNALERLYSEEFRRILDKSSSLYGQGGASKRIVEIIDQCPSSSLIKKKFHDIPQAKAL
jgi:GDP/UDP-N,N'-diacetylbacillosamine 2-epimerase (hydrolysing)